VIHEVESSAAGLDGIFGTTGRELREPNLKASSEACPRAMGSRTAGHCREPSVGQFSQSVVSGLVTQPSWPAWTVALPRRFPTLHLDFPHVCGRKRPSENPGERLDGIFGHTIMRGSRIHAQDRAHQGADEW